MATGGSVTLSEADYLRLLVHGGTAFELVRTALELDLFEHLEKAGGMDAEGLAAALGVAPQPARIMLVGLAALRLLTVHNGRYANTEMVRRKLLRSGSRFLGPLVDVQARIINPCLVDLAESVRQGSNVGLRHIPGVGATLYSRLAAHPALQQAFYTNMGDVSRKAFAQIRDRYDFSGVRHVLDLGGGDGTNAVELASRYPDLKVTVFDQPTVTQLAADRVSDPQLRARLGYHAGDLFADPLPTVADAILYFHIFEICSLARNTELLAKCHAALPDGGVCLVYNFATDDSGAGPLSAALMSPYFLAIATGDGEVYPAADMVQVVSAAGFSEVTCHPLLGFSHALVVGRK